MFFDRFFGLQVTYVVIFCETFDRHQNAPTEAICGSVIEAEMARRSETEDIGLRKHV